MPVTKDDPAFAATVAARRQRAEEDARCRHCGLTRLECRRSDELPYWCCPQCNHSDSLIYELVNEVADDSVRTVAETEPIQAPPAKPTMRWLLDQEDFWCPQYGPLLRILDMTDTHRWHTLRWLERRASRLAFDETLWMVALAAGPLGPSGDAACDGFEREMTWIQEHPLEWLRSRPLYEALGRNLPTVHGGKRSRKRFGRMLQRARHWSTCPRNRSLRAERCTCSSDVSQAQDVTASSGLST